MRQPFIFNSSELDKLHGYFVYFFESIYIQSLTPFSNWDDIFIHTNLKPIYSKCKKLRVLMETVHLEYITLLPLEKKLIFDNAKNSIEIEAICISSLTLTNRNNLSTEIGDAIHSLFKYVYYQLPTTKVFIDKYGKFIDHYNEMKKSTKIKMCPFCGLLPIKPLKSSKKQTYDHYFPLSLYPFVGIHTKNFVPTCKECNEDYKHDKDSLYVNSQGTLRRKLFYPYGNYNYKISIDLMNLTIDNATLKVNQCDVHLKCDSSNYSNELKTWIDIYEIDTRYKNTIEDDSDEWYNEFYDYIIKKQTDGTFIDMQAAYNEYRNALSVTESTSNSFLKVPYFTKVKSMTNVLD